MKRGCFQENKDLNVPTRSLLRSVSEDPIDRFNCSPRKSSDSYDGCLTDSELLDHQHLEDSDCVLPLSRSTSLNSRYRFAANKSNNYNMLREGLHLDLALDHVDNFQTAVSGQSKLSSVSVQEEEPLATITTTNKTAVDHVVSSTFIDDTGHSLVSNTVESATSVRASSQDEPEIQESTADNNMETDYNIEKSVPLSMSSLAWEAYELSSDWNKVLKSDHGILAALDLSLPLPLCNVDISSPTKHRDILDIFSDVNLDLPPLIDRFDSNDDRVPFSNATCLSPEPVEADPATTNNSLADMRIGVNDLDRSNTLMTPQELERMPDQGLEFEQSVGPKNPPRSPSTLSEISPLPPLPPPHDFTTITVMTSQGQKMFKVNTAQLCKAAQLMQPVVINADDKSITNTLVMLPVPKLKLLTNEELDATLGTQAKFKCLSCGKRFHRSYKLKIHEMMKHARVKPHACDHPGCKWAFPDAFKLKRHKQCHLGVREFTCSTCNKSFTTIWNLRSHYDSMHGDAAKFPCTVKGCKKKFSAESKLHKHIYMEHRDKAVMFVCKVPGCNAEYCTRPSLERHIQKSHIEQSLADVTCPFPYCGKVFSCPARLRQHIDQHTGEKKFKCTFFGCCASFSNNPRLRRHMMIHNDTPHKHKCSTCGKGFHRRDHLKNHEHIHGTERPFGCQYAGCNYRCTSASSLRMHVRRHVAKEGKVFLVCPEESCEDVFSTKYQIIKHVNAHHPNLVEAQYLQELPDHLLSTDNSKMTSTHSVQVMQSSNEIDEPLAAITAAAAEAETAPSSFVVPTVFRRPEMGSSNLTVQKLTSENDGIVTGLIRTEVMGGKQIDLIVPQELIASSSINSSISPELAGGQQLVIKKSTIKEVGKKAQKGSARTDEQLTQTLLDKARRRQQEQQKQKQQEPFQMPLPQSVVTTHIFPRASFTQSIAPASTTVLLATDSQPDSICSQKEQTLSPVITGSVDQWLLQDVPVSSGLTRPLSNVEESVNSSTVNSQDLEHPLDQSLAADLPASVVTDDTNFVNELALMDYSQIP